MTEKPEIEVHEVFEHSALGVDNRKLGIWIFLASEVLLFTALIGTFITQAHQSRSGPYPRDVLSLPLVSFNTFVLIGSSVAMVTALTHAQEGRTRKTVLWLAVTAGLGLVFLGGQAFEFYHLYINSLSMHQNLFGASFFTLTGTHGLHVFSGVIWILLMILHVLQHRGTQEQIAFKIELLGLYWHFVDLIWIIIFTFVYLLS